MTTSASSSCGATGRSSTRGRQRDAQRTAGAVLRDHVYAFYLQVFPPDPATASSDEAVDSRPRRPEH